MGWKPGQGLGKYGEGIKEPIKPINNMKKVGLGHSFLDKQKFMLKYQENSQKVPNGSVQEATWNAAREKFQEILQKEGEKKTAIDLT